MNATKTAGQKLAATLRKLNKVGTRTRRYRGNVNVVEMMLEDIRTATVYPGSFSTDAQTVLTSAWGVYSAWQKHIDGHRIDGALWGKIKDLSPWQTANLLGQMVDAGITNNGEAEVFFANLKIA
jgi:hypothetical protein